ncbi:hypothetical protein [Okeania sp. SIO1I7]|uniref:hypothetical protein n=1 Tax=Okeania sp. SIO1I7 TaxID=2607772 RepID=UPI0013F872F7|nr:hypothetical protein [Okeania sp. SIO1I7]NET24934.1 hypothetical protein [Okeania sp. SIO1I7]
MERAFRPKRGSTLEAGALKQKDLRARWLGIPRCHASAASGGCQIVKDRKMGDGEMGVLIIAWGL